MNKKGIELSMNVIIISILVILVLVVLAAFFLGGTSNLFKQIQSYSPSNMETATSDCVTKCQYAQAQDSVDIKKASSYCKKTIDVDINEDGRAEQKHHCWSSEIGIDCPGVTELCRTVYEDYTELSS